MTSMYRNQMLPLAQTQSSRKRKEHIPRRLPDESRGRIRQTHSHALLFRGLEEGERRRKQERRTAGRIRLLGVLGLCTVPYRRNQFVLKGAAREETAKRFSAISLRSSCCLVKLCLFSVRSVD
mmetsp:Transcript_30648/g.60313  ORF Transcript_30648/g.60313 Transcript_30648/m.60313 type:complete len:123 (-) Transcript_30648:1279-1647(-)